MAGRIEQVNENLNTGDTLSNLTNILLIFRKAKNQYICLTTA